MKKYDYTPDKPMEDCNDLRRVFYSCLKKFRSTEGRSDLNKATAFSHPVECASESENLHTCMMVNAFAFEKCRAEMGKLKRCTAKYSPEARRAMEAADDPQVADAFEVRDERSTVRRWLEKVLRV